VSIVLKSNKFIFFAFHDKNTCNNLKKYQQNQGVQAGPHNSIKEKNYKTNNKKKTPFNRLRG
jgi:hypothetical protein